MMGTLPGNNEFAMEEVGEQLKWDENASKHCMQNPGQKHSIEDDINRLFEAIDIKNTRETFRKSAMKRPIRASSSTASGIGISESIGLKQALRGLCISQASEMAALRRLSKAARLSVVSEAGTIKRLYRAVVIEAGESVHPLNENKGNLVEISLIPESSVSKSSERRPEEWHVSKKEQSNRNADSSAILFDKSTEKAEITQILKEEDSIVSLPPDVDCETLKTEVGQNVKMKSKRSSFSNQTNNKLPVIGEITSASVGAIKSLGSDKVLKSKFPSVSSPSSFGSDNSGIKSTSSGFCVTKPIFRNKTLFNKKTSNSGKGNGGDQKGLGSGTGKMVCQTLDCDLKSESKGKEKTTSGSSGTNVNTEISSGAMNSSVNKPDFSSNCSESTMDASERSVSKEKGEFSQSSTHSIGEYSSSTSIREEGHLNGSGHSRYRPHMSKNLRWEAIQCVQKQHGSLTFRHFKLLRKIGAGDYGRIYLADLTGTSCLFALKVTDNEFLASRKKLQRVQTEREILQMLDHPFLPTLFAHFTADRFSCLVMDYCPGGDLHVLRQKQPNKSFSEQKARFYVAEVLLALEYLHMLGVVYRDLKPENILVREDGHIMLSDFDLSLRCAVNSTPLESSSAVVGSPKRVSNLCSESSCIEPFCFHPSWQVPCFTPRFLSAAAKSRKLKSDVAAQVIPPPEVVIKPTNAQSNSFVGTHEYVAPEIIKGEGHGSSVDWWSFGIFLYELLYGRTPFKGGGNKDTLMNVVSQCLEFPQSPVVSSHARDLIRRLLQKEPENRLGTREGAVVIKQHPFFEGLNWALIRCATPPELPKPCAFGIFTQDVVLQNKDSTKSRKEFKSTGQDVDFEMF